MSKSLLYHLFRIGCIPADARPVIEREGIVLQDEGIGGSVTFKNFRAPGRRYGWRRNLFCGSIVLTKLHFLAFKYSEPVIGVPWQDERMQALDCYLLNEKTLCVAFDAAVFHEGWTGDIEVRFRTSQAPAFLDLIGQMRDG